MNTQIEVEEDIKRYPFVADLRGCSQGVKYDANKGFYYVDGSEVKKDEFWRQFYTRCSRTPKGDEK